MGTQIVNPRTMKRASRISIVILFGAILGGQAQEDLPPFRCPESNGFFPDPEQCDLYYECIDNVPEAKLCPDGLLFEDGNPNQEKCDYPFNVECNDREYVQEPETGIDPVCYRANGFFNHEDPAVCDKFYNCVYGKAHELPCATSLVFDEAQGTCVRPEQASVYSKKCEVKMNQWESMASFVPKRTSLDLMVRNWLILASLTQPVVRNLSLVILAKISRS